MDEKEPLLGGSETQYNALVPKNEISLEPQCSLPDIGHEGAATAHRNEEIVKVDSQYFPLVIGHRGGAVTGHRKEEIVEGCPELPSFSSYNRTMCVSKDTFSSESGVKQLNSSVGPFVTCRVCQNAINIADKDNQYVVKCLHCNEATPIHNAPPGKKYVRCPCRCLLVCKETSQKVYCPRTNCGRIISLSNTSKPSLPSMPGMCRVCCQHCSQFFLFNTLTNALARCPHCRKVSSVGPDFARGRGTVFLIAGVAVLIILFVLIVFTFNNSVRNNAFLIAAYIILFLLAIVTLSRSLYYYTMKISQIQESL